MGRWWIIPVLLLIVSARYAGARCKQACKQVAAYKIATIDGPITAAFAHGSICIHYEQDGVAKTQCKDIQPGKAYAFKIPAYSTVVHIDRYYQRCNQVARGRFRVKGTCDATLALEASGNKLRHHRPRLARVDDQLPPLHTGIVYGWTWR